MGHVAWMDVTFFVRKPERKRPLGRPRHRWVDNVKLDHKEIGCGLDSSDSGCMW